MTFLVMWENGLIRKLKLISKFMTSQPKKKQYNTYILPNTSRSKGNQRMIFGQLIEYNVRYIFLQK